MRCLNGNAHCAEGEFCYRDFVCDPPRIPETTTTSSIADVATVPTHLPASLGSSNTGSNPSASSGSNGSSTTHVIGETTKATSTTTSAGVMDSLTDTQGSSHTEKGSGNFTTNIDGVTH